MEQRPQQGSHEDLENRFRHHTPEPGDGKAEKYGANRAELLAVAKSIGDRIPGSRERSVFFTKLEEAMFWANAAVARNP